MDSTSKIGANQPQPGSAEPFSDRLSPGWEGAILGFLAGAPVGGIVGFFVAFSAVALSGVGGDNYSGNRSQNLAEEILVCVGGLVLGATVCGGLLALVGGLIGCVWGVVAGKHVSSEEAEVEKGNAEKGSATDRGNIL